MTLPVRVLGTSLALALMVSTAPLTAQAAGSGVAYDAVSKIVLDDGSAPPPAPGSFQADWAAASQPPPAAKGGMFGKMIAAAQGMGAMFKTGTATRHYDGTTKFRIDTIATNSADITDCTARTLTHLDLAAKTYHVTSLDQPSSTPVSSGGGHQAPGPAATDDGTTYTFTIVNKALGPMTIEGIATNGYDQSITMTATKRDGETSSSNFDTTSYYAAMPDPRAFCAPKFAPTPSGDAHMPAPNFAAAMAALGGVKDSRFKVSVSGPTPPGGFSMWMLMAAGAAPSGSSTGNERHAFRMMTEHGNVRSITDADPAFSIPAGFTQV